MARRRRMPCWQAPSRHRCCAKSAAPPCPRQRETSGRPARREARVPAGQLKNTAPLGARSAGQSATLENPAHFLTLPIVTRRAKTTGLVRAANRAGRPKGSGQPLFDPEFAEENLVPHFSVAEQLRPANHFHVEADVAEPAEPAKPIGHRGKLLLKLKPFLYFRG